MLMLCLYLGCGCDDVLPLSVLVCLLKLALLALPCWRCPADALSAAPMVTRSKSTRLQWRGGTLVHPPLKHVYRCIALVREYTRLHHLRLSVVSVSEIGLKCRAVF